jgi:hypothetical protein
MGIQYRFFLNIEQHIQLGTNSRLNESILVQGIRAPKLRKPPLLLRRFQHVFL